MEVHPPHEPVHSWRDALIHIGLMTVGLFIALMLEGGVEYLHHKELVHQARENIHTELEHNHENAQKNIADLKTEAEHMKAGIDTIHRFQHDPNGHGSIEFHWNFNNLSNAAWQSARDTGALGYMPYNEVQEYAELYAVQALTTEQLQQVQFHEAELLAPLMAQHEGFTGMPADQFQLMLNDAARAYLDLTTLSQYLSSLDEEYKNELKRSH